MSKSTYTEEQVLYLVQNNIDGEPSALADACLDAWADSHHWKAAYEVADRAAQRLDDGLRRILDLVTDGDMPAVGGIVQADLVTRSYVKLASLIHEVADDLLDGNGKQIPGPIPTGDDGLPCAACSSYERCARHAPKCIACGGSTPCDCNEAGE